MPNNTNHIRVFEHKPITKGQEIDGVIFDEHKLKALQLYYGKTGVPYFSLIHNGVRFNEFVGVIQVGNLVIEVLPKADNNISDVAEKAKWHEILIQMLLAVGVFDIHAPSSSTLNLKTNSILDLYFELFIKEVEYLLHQGLIKQYRKVEGNVTVLKGSLLFSKHIRHNLTHQERFYVRHNTYDIEHTIHLILYKAILLLKRINTNHGLQSRIGALLLHFPEMPDVKVTEATFNKIIFNRKNQSYKPAFEIARLLLLQYHPDVSRGRDHILALMFDMNKLWEQFVYVSLRKHKAAGYHIIPQPPKPFWKPESGSRSGMRPDIVIKYGETCTVLDTKWKNLGGKNPSPDDLRQMYIYHEYFRAQKVALLYPGEKSLMSGNYLDPVTEKELEKVCSVITFTVESNIKSWQKNIHSIIENWMNMPGSNKKS